MQCRVRGGRRPFGAIPGQALHRLVHSFGGQRPPRRGTPRILHPPGSPHHDTGQPPRGRGPRPPHAGRAGHRGRARHPAAGPRRLPDARCEGRCALCRQGAQPEAAGRHLYPAGPPARTAPADGVRDPQPGGRDHRLRGRGAAARSQSDQAAAAALQHRPARRQILSLARADRGPSLPPDRQAPRGAPQGCQLLGALRLRLGGEPDAHRAAARLPAAVLPRHGVRQPHAALPAVPDQALRRPLRAARRRSGLRGTGARGEGISLGRHPLDPEAPGGGDGTGRRKTGIRTRGVAPRPHPRPDPCAGPRPDQHRRAGRRGYRGAAPDGRAVLRAGLLLPRRPQQRQPAVFPVPRQGRTAARGGARRLPGPAL